MEPPSPLDRACVRAVEPDAGRHGVPVDRCRGRSSAVGNSSRAVSDHVRRDVRRVYSTRVVAVCNRFFPLVLLYLTWLLVSEARLPLAPMAATHLIAFFVIAIVCHGALAADRPAATRLTDFYLSLAIGGALGGVFNSLLAPVLFTSVIEYPIALACGILLLTFTSGTQPLRSRPRWWVEPAVVVMLTIVALKWPGTGIRVALIVWGLLLAAVIVFLSISRERRRLGISVLLMLGLYVVIGGRGFVDVAYASRTFFGTYRVIVRSSSIDRSRSSTARPSTDARTSDRRRP